MSASNNNIIIIITTIIAIRVTGMALLGRFEMQLVT
jgi:hypothetical protein